jgi:uncharacterized protein YegP (UPF0339 family)
MNIEIEQNCNNAWFWRLRADNGECLAISEAYSSKAMCKKTANVVAKAANLSVKEKVCQNKKKA